MIRSARTVLLAAVGLIVSALAAFFLANAVDLAATVRVLATANLGMVGGAIGVLAVGLGVRIARWRLLLPRRRDERLPLRRLIAPVLIGYLGNVILPARLGEGVRAASVWRREGIGLPETLGSVAIERVLDATVIAILGFLAAAWLGAPEWLVAGTAIVAAVASAILITLLSGIGGHVASRVRPTGSRGVRLARAAERFLRAASVQDRAGIWGALGLTGIAWILDAAIVWLGAGALSTSLDPPAAMAIAAVAVLGTAIPAAPGYVGTYELAASAAGTAVGLSAETALALAVLVHALTLVPLTIAGIVAAMTVGAGLSAELQPIGGEGLAGEPQA
jgi:uncharacterized protein (TIRG00374 family)